MPIARTSLTDWNEGHVSGERFGREYSVSHSRAPCSSYLLEHYGLGPCGRHYFLKAYERARAEMVGTGPIDLRVRECRCAQGCNQDIFQ